MQKNIKVSHGVATRPPFRFPPRRGWECRNGGTGFCDVCFIKTDRPDGGEKFLSVFLKPLITADGGILWAY